MRNDIRNKIRNDAQGGGSRSITAEAFTVAQRKTDREGFVDRLNELIRERKSLRAFAALIGVTEGTVRVWLQRAEPGRDKLVAIVKATGVSLNWLAAGIGPRQYSETPEGYVAIPVFDYRKTGAYMFPMMKPVDRTLVRRDSLRPDLWQFADDTLLAMHALDDALRPLIMKGDLVVVCGASFPHLISQLPNDQKFQAEAPCMIVRDGRVSLRLVRYQTGLPPKFIVRKPGDEKPELIITEGNERGFSIVGRVIFRAGYFPEHREEAY
ncbi:MAG: helix-turn-helix domain-containing protein [Candidatus Binataceae bacterium]